MSTFSSSNWIMCNIKSLFYLQDILSKKTSIQYSVHSMYDVKCMLTLWFVALYFRPHSRMVVWLMKFCGCLLIVFYFAIPAFIKLYPAIVVDIAFLNMSMYFFCIIFQLQKIFSVFANSGYSVLGPRACFIPGGFRALVGPFLPYPQIKPSFYTRTLMDGVGECWTHSCVHVHLTATAVKACVVYVYGDHQLTSL